MSKTPKDVAAFIAKNPTPPMCQGKVRYETELDAAVALFKIQYKWEGAAREQRIYKHHHHWHITSQPKKEK